MKLSAGTIASLEAIAFQSPNLFKEISGIFQSILNDGYKGDKNNDQFSSTPLRSIVFKYTGILVDCEWEHVGFAAVAPPRINTNNILISEMNRNKYWNQQGNAILAENKEVTGLVNKEQGKVSGILSKALSVIYFSPHFFFEQKYTAEELAATYLHELGHIFSYFEFLVDTVSTNQILNNISKTLLETADFEERKIILTDVEKKLNINIPDLVQLAKTEDKNTVHAVLISARIDSLRSSTGSWVYDIKSWEALADQFAARHGAGRYIATVLYKMDKASMYGRSTTNRILFLAAQVYMTVSILFAATFSWFFLLYGLAYFAAGFVIDKSEHDNLEQRINRLKNDSVEALKVATISKTRKEEILEEIKCYDALLANISDKRIWTEAFWDYVRPAKRDARKQYLLQVELEKLAANSLFVQAAKLSTLH